MAAKRGAGDLRHRYAFDKRVDVGDGYGNTKGRWDQQIDCRAGVVHLRGGEDVMAGRLSGTHTLLVFVLASSLTRQVTTGWRMRDLRKGEFVDGVWNGPTFNIRDITPSNDRMWLDFLIQSGGAD
jgi:head-tail adaptor